MDTRILLHPDILFPSSTLYYNGMQEIKTPISLPKREQYIIDSNFVVDVRFSCELSSSINIQDLIFIGEILPNRSRGRFQKPIFSNHLKTIFVNGRSGKEFPLYLGTIIQSSQSSYGCNTAYELQVDFLTESAFKVFNSHWSGQGFSFIFQNHCFVVTMLLKQTSAASSGDETYYVPITSRSSPPFRMKRDCAVHKSTSAGLTSNYIHQFVDTKSFTRSSSASVFHRQAQESSLTRSSSAPYTRRRNTAPKVREYLHILQAGIDKPRIKNADDLSSNQSRWTSTGDHNSELEPEHTPEYISRHHRRYFELCAQSEADNLCRSDESDDSFDRSNNSSHLTTKGTSGEMSDLARKMLTEFNI